MKPFRWDLTKVEQLGNLLNCDANPAYQEYQQDLSDCAAKVVARSQGRKLIFIGRSPENLFDYLCGIFETTDYAAHLDILNISNRWQSIDEIKLKLPKSYQALKAHFQDIGISPEQIIATPNGICFCDLVCDGYTYENLFSFIKKWALEENSDFPAIERKLSFIGITSKTKNSPNTWRWQQEADWVKEHNKLSIKNVSIECSLWSYLGNVQHKVSNTNPPKRWSKDDVLLPPRKEDNIRALKQAYDIYHAALQHKLSFASKLAACPEIKEPWLRHMVQALQGKASNCRL